jgi:hypothetical protein
VAHFFHCNDARQIVLVERASQKLRMYKPIFNDIKRQACDLHSRTVNVGVTGHSTGMVPLPETAGRTHDTIIVNARSWTVTTHYNNARSPPHDIKHVLSVVRLITQQHSVWVRARLTQVTKKLPIGLNMP